MLQVHVGTVLGLRMALANDCYCLMDRRSLDDQAANLSNSQLRAATRYGHQAKACAVATRRTAVHFSEFAKEPVQLLL